jgi:hypothetical protein
LSKEIERADIVPPFDLDERTLELILSSIQESDHQAGLQAILKRNLKPRIQDLWAPSEAATTYWVLLLSGLNQEDEVEIAQAMLLWQAFMAKDSAQLICLQSSERDSFKCCSSFFATHDCPVLIVSDSALMTPFVKIEGALLATLMSKKGNLQRFASTIHGVIDSGKTIEDVKGMLTTQKFWSNLKLVYKEIKDIVSIGIGK